MQDADPQTDLEMRPICPSDDESGSESSTSVRQL